MNAQDLAALGTMIRETIEKHVVAAAEATSQAFNEALSERDKRIAELEARKGYDDTALASRVQTLETLTSGDVQDDTLVDDVYWKLEDRLKALIPAAYDDSGIREELKTVAKALASVEEKLGQVKAYDDTELRTWVGQQLKSVPPAYDDAWARQSFEAVQTTLDTLKSVKPYDDTGLRSEMSQALSSQISSIEGLLEQVTQLSERPDPTPARDGAPGADGRDALQIELLPAIDATKSYPRGTYAKHNGGTWRAYEQTHGMRGWECTQDGIAAITPKLEGKQLVLTIVQSSGTESVLVADLPIQEYKGVYSPEGDGYAAHDTVTWAGSLWHCNKTGTTAKPGDGSPDWTLAVKKGRDGREVVTVPREQKPVHIGGGA